MGFKKEILYPIFLDCCVNIKNDVWKQIFEDLAYGICPYKCFINKGYLCCNIKNKNFIYKITNKKDPAIVYEEIKKLFDEKLNILGEDRLTKDIEDECINKINKWSKIKKKNIREFMINRFLVDTKDKYNIDNSDIKKLKKNIILGMMFKTISTDDIIIENGHISKINNISFEKNKIIFEKDFIEFEIIQNNSDEEISEKKSLYNLYLQKKNKLVT